MQIETSHIHYQSICTLIKLEEDGGALVKVEWSTLKAKMEVMAPGCNVAGVPFYVVDLESQNGTVRDQLVIKKLVGGNELLPLPFLPKHFSMICLIWNCRGAGISMFQSKMSELISNHNPDVLFLLKTKVPLSVLNNFFTKRGFKESSFSNPMGRSRGIWVLWNSSNVTVSAVEVTSQVIHATISIVDREDWIFS